MQEKSSNASSAEEDAEYEDESDHQDYDANYFDNGEGDDDEGGEDGTSTAISGRHELTSRRRRREWREL
jgi:hypothetical protein